MKLEELDLYLTNRCNLSCDFCSVEARKNCEELSFDRIKELVTEAKECGLEELHLTGGEPTLRNDLEQIVSFAVALGLNVRLITNGTTLTRERLVKLQNNGLHSIMISLDGEQEYHDRVRGSGAYAKTLQIIQIALELGFFVRVNSVAWQDNRNEIIRLAHRLNEIGVFVYSIFLGSPLGYAQSHKDNVIPPYEWRQFYTELKAIATMQGYNTKIVVEKGFLFPDEAEFDTTALLGRGRGCHNITDYYDFLLIRSNGDMYPCVFFSNEATPIGNVNNASIGDILQSYAQNEFYCQVGQYPKPCAECSNLRHCKGGCRGYTKLYTGDWFGGDPRCQGNGSDIFPLCPIVKYNLNEGIIGGSSEQVLK